MTRTYYPGFFGALFLVLLRVAIGWHFLYEGAEKVTSRLEGVKPFTAEPFLRNATGPLAPWFRGLVPDVNSLAKLDHDRLQALWTKDIDQIAQHYQFSPAQRTEADAVLDKSLVDADVWLKDKEFQDKKRKYLDELVAVQAAERDPRAVAFQRQRAADRRKDLDTQRKELIKDIDAVGGALREAVVKIASDDQRAEAGPYTPRYTQLDWINWLTAYSLVAMGVCLILGLFTPLAALAAAGFLAQIYLSMPPWPWLPPSPIAEGHYMFVNKNLVEMIACLALVFVPTGQWIGVDALLFGGRRRRRELEARQREAAARDGEPGIEPDHDHGRRTHTSTQPRIS